MLREVIYMSTLRNVKCGETAKVLKVTGSGPLKRRIMDMGITKGTEICTQSCTFRRSQLKSMFADMS